MVKIVSLLPSTTEIVCALGYRDALVGRSHECDFPPGVEALPVLTSAKLDSSRDSAAIDGDVKRLVRDGLSIYRVDDERLRELAPDVILTQDQCEVCAASLGDVESALERAPGVAPRVVSLSPQTLGDVWDDLERVADALGDAPRGRALKRELADRVSGIVERFPAPAERPRIACIEWTDPLMAAGNWVPELVALAGAELVAGHTGAHSPWLAFEELARLDPDVIAVFPCGFDLARTRVEMAPLVARPEWSQLAAVRSGRVALADGNAFFNRPGPRLVESLEILVEMLHEGADFGHRAAGAWEPL